MRKTYDILVDDDDLMDSDGELHINLTDEGLIVDVIAHDGQTQEVCAFTAQELYDQFASHYMASKAHTPERKFNNGN